MKNSLFLALFPLSLMYLSTAQAAQDSDLYLGAQFSNQKITSSSNVKFDTAGMILGYQFNQYFSFETRLNLGVSEYSSLCPCGDVNGDYVYKQKINNQGSLLIKGAYPIYGDFSIYALAGMTKTSYSLATQNQNITVDGNKTISEITFQDTENHSESGLTYGIGINYQITNEFIAFLDYQALPDITTNTFGASSWKSASIGVNYIF